MNLNYFYELTTYLLPIESPPEKEELGEEVCRIEIPKSKTLIDLYIYRSLSNRFFQDTIDFRSNTRVLQLVLSIVSLRPQEPQQLYAQFRGTPF